jgi:hypothetical protein
MRMREGLRYPWADSTEVWARGEVLEGFFQPPRSQVCVKAIAAYYRASEATVVPRNRSLSCFQDFQVPEYVPAILYIAGKRCRPKKERNNQSTRKSNRRK